VGSSRKIAGQENFGWEVVARALLLFLLLLRFVALLSSTLLAELGCVKKRYRYQTNDTGRVIWGSGCWMLDVWCCCIRGHPEPPLTLPAGVQSALPGVITA
jgi:hypothetical protein